MDSVVAQWLAGNDTGTSSKTIAFWLGAGIRYNHPSTPSDCGDLGRCLRLLALKPEWEARLPEMAEVLDTWATFAARWSEMKESYLAESGGLLRPSRGVEMPKTYRLMRLVDTEAYEAAGYDVKKRENGEWYSVSKPGGVSAVSLGPGLSVSMR